MSHSTFKPHSNYVYFPKAVCLKGYLANHGLIYEEDPQAGSLNFLCTQEPIMAE